MECPMDNHQQSKAALVCNYDSPSRRSAAFCDAKARLRLQRGRIVFRFAASCRFVSHGIVSAKDKTARPRGCGELPPRGRQSPGIYTIRNRGSNDLMSTDMMGLLNQYQIEVD